METAKIITKPTKELLARYMELTAQVKVLNEEAEAVKAKLIKLMDGADKLIKKDGIVCATYTRHERDYFEAKKLEINHPDLYNKYLKKIEYFQFKPKAVQL